MGEPKNLPRPSIMAPHLISSGAAVQDGFNGGTDVWTIDEVRDLQFAEKYGSDLRVVDEETWLTGPDIITKYRRSAPPVRSASMSILNESTLYPHHDTFHSTPRNSTKKAEPIDCPENGNGSSSTPVLHKTMDRDSLAKAFGAVSPVRNLKDSETATASSVGSSNSVANRTFEKNDETSLTKIPNLEKMRILPKKNAGPPVTKNKLIRPPTGAPPVTRPVSSLNRTSSLGSLNGVKPVVSSGLHRPRAPVNAINNGAGDSVRPGKIPPPSRIPAPSKIPASIPSRIPRPASKK